MWQYQGQPVINPPEDVIGFIYQVTNTTNQKFYIGKKNFYIPKKARGKGPVVYTMSNWRTYQSSCLSLKADIAATGIEHFTFEILKFCETPAELSYQEVRYQFQKDVLKVDAYNANIAGRYFRNKLT